MKTKVAKTICSLRIENEDGFGMNNPKMRYRKDYACLDKSSSGEVISQRSRVRRFYDFNTV